jgi:hypothetical protein
MTKSQADLIRGIRNNKDREAQYINTCMQEIKQELAQQDFDIKANAVDKLIYVWCTVKTSDVPSCKCWDSLWTLLVHILCCDSALT